MDIKETKEQEKEKEELITVGDFVKSIDKQILFDLKCQKSEEFNKCTYDKGYISQEIYFCETCFENIYSNNLDSIHENHILVKIDETKLITNEELDKINKNLKSAENKVLKYLPDMRDMLINDCKNEKEKKEIMSYTQFSIDKNLLILSILKLVYNSYILEKKLMI